MAARTPASLVPPAGNPAAARLSATRPPPTRPVARMLAGTFMASSQAVLTLAWSYCAWMKAGRPGATASSSASVSSRRSPAHCSSCHPPSVSSHCPSPSPAALRASRPSAAARVRTPSSRTSACSVARTKWLWLSISPGITVLPPRSTTRASGAARARTAASSPTAVIHSPSIATAWRTENCSSTVTIFPLTRTRAAMPHCPALDPGPLDRAETDVICCLGSADGWGGAAMTGLLEDTIAAVGPLDAAAVVAARERQEALTKPSGSLGRLEDVSVQLAGIASQCPPPLPEPAVVAVFAADHGVHAQGVSPWPQEVTAQMVANFLASGAAVNAIAAQAGAAVYVVDVGVAADLPTAQGLLSRKVRPGTADMTEGSAMTLEEARLAVETGIKVAADLVDEGYRCLITGDMGIANTTASAALIAVFAGSTPALVTGRGTGIDDPTWARKVEVVRRALDLHRCDPASPLETLAAVGGLEHAALAGFILGGAARRVPVLLDGVIACAAAVAARAFAPQVTDYLIAGHLSTEPGALRALDALGLRPLLDLGMRLGEGSGAVLALPVVAAAARVLRDMATFDSAGVSGEKA